MPKISKEIFVHHACSRVLRVKDINATDSTIITKASEQTIERLVDFCTRAQQIWLEDTKKQLIKGDHSNIYKRLTGEDMPDSPEKGTETPEAAKDRPMKAGFIAAEEDIPQRFALPDTRKSDGEAANRAYERRAADIAETLLVNYFSSYDDESLDAYAKGTSMLKFAFKKDPDNLGLLESAIDSGNLALTKEDASALERSFNRTIDHIVEAMASLDEREPIPFYIDLEFDEGEEYTLEPSVKKVKRIILQTKDTDFTPLIIDSPAIPDKKLSEDSEDYFRGIATQSIDKVITQMIAPHMKRLEHPLFDLCFIQDHEQPGRYNITEQGADILESEINRLTTQATVGALRERLMMADHFDGYRLRMIYEVLPDDDVMMQPAIEYLCPQKNRLTFNIPAIDIDLEDGKERERLRSFYEKRVARDILTKTLAYNMDATSHPALDAYFTTDEDKQPALTEKGLRIFGEQIDIMSEELAQEMIDLTNGSAGGKYILDYTLNHSGIEYAHISKIIDEDLRGRDSLIEDGNKPKTHDKVNR